MPLATKNNALIVKDGKVAENCNCCGGWYCLPCACQGRRPDALRVEVSMTCASKSATFSVRMISRTTRPDCGTYSVSWGPVYQALEDLDTAVEGNTIVFPEPYSLGGYAYPISGQLKIEFTQQCESYVGWVGGSEIFGAQVEQVSEELSNAVILTARGVSAAPWKLGSDFIRTGFGYSPGVYRTSNQFDQPRQWIMRSFLSASPVCYLDFSTAGVPISWSAGYYSSVLLSGTLSLRVTGEG